MKGTKKFIKEELEGYMPSGLQFNGLIVRYYDQGIVECKDWKESFDLCIRVNVQNLTSNMYVYMYYKKYKSLLTETFQPL